MPKFQATTQLAAEEVAVDNPKSLSKSMLPGAPWLLAHKSMLSANKPMTMCYGRIGTTPFRRYLMFVRIWGRCCLKAGVNPKRTGPAKSFVHFTRWRLTVKVVRFCHLL